MTGGRLHICLVLWYIYISIQADTYTHKTFVTSKPWCNFIRHNNMIDEHDKKWTTDYVLQHELIETVACGTTCFKEILQNKQHTGFMELHKCGTVSVSSPDSNGGVKDEICSSVANVFCGFNHRDEPKRDSWCWTCTDVDSRVHRFPAVIISQKKNGFKVPVLEPHTAS